MRIVNFFKNELIEKKPIKNEEPLVGKIEKLKLKLPCNVNLYYSVEEKIVFNTDMLSLSWEIIDETLTIDKTHSVKSYNGNENSIDIYLNQHLKMITAGSETILNTHDFGHILEIKTFENAKVVVPNLSVRSFKAETINESELTLLKSTKTLNEIILTSQADSKIHAKDVEAVKGKIRSTGLSFISTCVIESLETTLQGLSNQDVYGEPPRIEKEILGGMGNLKLIQNN